MSEQNLRDILKQKLEVPNMVNKRLEEVYTQMEQKEHPAQRRGARPMRAALIAAAVAAALCVTAGAAYVYYVRQNVPVDQGQTAQSVAGAGLPSWQREEFHDPEGGNSRHYPRREVAQTDPAQAQNLLGEYLPETGYQWQIEDYTLTVEGYLLDELTGTAKFIYTLEHPGGFGEDAVDWEHGLLNRDKFKPSVSFETNSAVDEAWAGFGGRTYVDTTRSTEEKLCIVSSLASFEPWKAADGITVTFRVQGDVHNEVLPDGGTNVIRDDPELEAELELPGVKSLPAMTLTDPATGKTVLLSAVGLKLDCADIDQVDSIVIDLADGSRYLVEDAASDLDNSDYGLGSGEYPKMTLRTVFNRLVDVNQVTAVTVDGVRYGLAE